MTPSEKAIWDEAFQVAIAACKDHVDPVNKGEYRDKVANAFIQNIRNFKKAAEKKKAEATCPIVVRYSTTDMTPGHLLPTENRCLRIDLPIASQDWPIWKTREYVMPILQKKHPNHTVNVRGVDWNPPPLHLTGG